MGCLEQEARNCRRAGRFRPVNLPVSRLVQAKRSEVFLCRWDGPSGVR